MSETSIPMNLDDRLKGIENRLSALERAIELVDTLFIPEILDALKSSITDLRVEADAGRLEGFYDAESSVGGSYAWVKFETGGTLRMFLIRGTVYSGALRLGNTKNTEAEGSLVFTLNDRPLQTRFDKEDGVHEFVCDAGATGWHYFKLNSKEPIMPSLEGSADIRVLGPMFLSLELVPRASGTLVEKDG